MKHFRSLVSSFLLILVFISLSCILPSKVKAQNNKQHLTAVSGPKSGEVTLYWQHADSADDYHLVYGRQKDNFEYGALNIGRVESFTVSLLSPGTSYRFALVPLFGGRPLYTTDQAEVRAGRQEQPVSVVITEVSSEVKPEDLVNPDETVSPESENNNPEETKNQGDAAGEILYQESGQEEDEAGMFSQEEESKIEEPICQRIGSDSEGWYFLAAESENDRLIKRDKCEDCYAFCKGIDSGSDGWYNSCDSRLIVRAPCKSNSNSLLPL